MHYRSKYGIKPPFLRKVGGADASMSKDASTPTQRNHRYGWWHKRAEDHFLPFLTSSIISSTSS